MEWADLPNSFYLIGQYNADIHDMQPLYFDLPSNAIAIPIWSSKTLAFTWLQGTFFQATYDIIEVKKDRFVPNLIGTRCRCLVLNPTAGENAFPENRVFDVPLEPPAPPPPPFVT